MMEWIAWVSIGLAVLSAGVSAVDEVRRPQKMGVMNLVWPITALYLSVIAVWWYWRVGRRMAAGSAMEMGGRGHGAMGGSETGSPTFGQSALATSHCGAGCVLGDLV